MRQRPLSMAEIRLAESLLAPLSDETGRILNPVRRLQNVSGLVVAFPCATRN